MVGILQALLQVLPPAVLTALDLESSPDELLEVTPKSLRLRKKILTKKDRKRVERYGE